MAGFSATHRILRAMIRPGAVDQRPLVTKARKHERGVASSFPNGEILERGWGPEAPKLNPMR